MGYPSEAELDRIINEATQADDDTPDGAIIIGWAVCVAYRTPDQLDGGATSHAFFAPSGQPAYASAGLLMITEDWIRESPNDPPEASG